MTMARSSSPVDVGDVWMIERRQRPCFPLEAREPFGVVRHVGRQHLDGDVALQLGVARAIDHAHPTLADKRGDLVRSEPTAKC
jgi:hypothetical protein